MSGNDSAKKPCGLVEARINQEATTTIRNGGPMLLRLVVVAGHRWKDDLDSD